MGSTKFIIQKGNKPLSVSGLLPIAPYLKKGHHMVLHLYTLAMTISPVRNDFLPKCEMMHIPGPSIRKGREKCLLTSIFQNTVLAYTSGIKNPSKC